MHIIFIAANESTNAGERDYLLGFSQALEAQHQESVTATAYKIGFVPEDNEKLKKLPLNNADYERMESYNLSKVIDEVIAKLQSDKKILILGAGHSTIPQISEIAHTFNESNSSDSVKKIRLAVVTHMIEDADIRHLFGKNIKVFSKGTCSDIGKQLIQIDAVPHTATGEGIGQSAMDMLSYSPNAERLSDIFNGKKPYAIAVLNAGFKVGEEHIPYYEEEAYDHGKALGQSLTKGTSLVLVDGGPRNNIDRREHGQANVEAFKNGFFQGAAQVDGCERHFVHEAFEFGLPYNAVFGAMHFANGDNCKAFISNAEGYGTMDAVFNLIRPSNGKLIGMIPFEANARDKSGMRLANIEDYNRRGITKLKVGEHGFVRHLSPNHVESDFEKPIYDATRVILNALEVPGFSQLIYKENPKAGPERYLG